MIIVVYARCSAIEILELWEELEWMAEGLHIPWIVGGDFNVILNDSKKLGGLLVTQVETFDFAQCASNCALTEFPFCGSIYTWWNGRTREDSIFKRLDRLFGNEVFWQECNLSEVNHLTRDGSDQAPLQVICRAEGNIIKKSFRFLNFWTKHHSFKEIVAKS